jgi:hypothetical protein
MVLVSEDAKRERFNKAVLWLKSAKNDGAWTKDDIAFSQKVAYYVPKQYYAKDKLQIDDDKVFELMRSQGWKGKIPTTTSSPQAPPPSHDTVNEAAPNANLASNENEEHHEEALGPMIVPGQEDERNPLVIFDGYMKAVREILVENIQYISKDEEISNLRNEVNQLQQQVSHLKRKIRDMEDDANVAIDCVRRLHKRSCE